MQFGMAGHVMRKTDGRWSNALLNWNEGKTQGHNTTTLYWEHDIEVWIKKIFPDDHSTWQQLAKNADQWTKWRDEYAEDWPSSHSRTTSHNDTTVTRALDGHSDTYHTSHKNTTSRSSQRQVQNKPPYQCPPEQEDDKEPTKIAPIDRVLQRKNYDKDNQKGCPHSRLIPLPGGRRRITIVLNPARQAAQEAEANH